MEEVDVLEVGGSCDWHEVRGDGVDVSGREGLQRFVHWLIDC